MSKFAINMCFVLVLVGGCSNFHKEAYSSKLQEITEEGATNHTFQQLTKPTEQQKIAGKKALVQWKKASRSEKNRIVSDLLLGNALLGMTQEKVVEHLGMPDGFGTLNEVGPNIVLIGYDVASGESQCDLRIEFKNNKVVRATLDVNY